MEERQVERRAGAALAVVSVGLGGAILEDLSQRVATAIGRCDACGGQVLE
jgi:hypothetical protein